MTRTSSRSSRLSQQRTSLPSGALSENICVNAMAKEREKKKENFLAVENSEIIHCMNKILLEYKKDRENFLCSAICVQSHGPESLRLLCRKMTRKGCPGGGENARYRRCSWVEHVLRIPECRLVRQTYTRDALL